MSRTLAVTGVASGIGAQIAAQLKQQGDRVIGFDLHEPAGNVDVYVPLDLTDADSIAAAVSQVGEPLHGLSNNAGLPPRAGLEAAILRVNFFGTRAFTQAMLEKLEPGSAIVNMASRAGSRWRDSVDQNKRLGALTGGDDLEGFIASEGLDPVRCYDLSKEAVILWTMAMTEPLIAKGLRANSVSPGAVSTGILDDFARAFGDRMHVNVARAGRPAEAREVAELACFLLSDASSWIKGTDLPIDGGMGGFNITDALGIGGMAGG